MELQRVFTKINEIFLPVIIQTLNVAQEHESNKEKKKKTLMKEWNVG